MENNKSWRLPLEIALVNVGKNKINRHKNSSYHFFMIQFFFSAYYVRSRYVHDRDISFFFWGSLWNIYALDYLSKHHQFYIYASFVIIYILISSFYFCLKLLTRKVRGRFPTPNPEMDQWINDETFPKSYDKSKILTHIQLISVIIVYVYIRKNIYIFRILLDLSQVSTLSFQISVL